MEKFLDDGKLRIYHQQIYPKGMSKGISLSEKEMVKEGFLEHQRERTMERVKISLNIMHFPIPLEYPISCLIFKAKIITLSDVALMYVEMYLRKLYK